MYLLLVAIDYDGYQSVRPIVEKQQRVGALLQADWRGELRKDSNFNFHQTTRSQDVLQNQLEVVGRKHGKEVVSLNNDHLHLAAYWDAIDAYISARPDRKPIVGKLRKMVVMASELSTVCVELRAALDFPVDAVIARHGYFCDEIPMVTYREALSEVEGLLATCRRNGYGLLNIIAED
jgi:hypothetical protein